MHEKKQQRKLLFQWHCPYVFIHLTIHQKNRVVARSWTTESNEARFLLHEGKARSRNKEHEYICSSLAESLEHFLVRILKQVGACVQLLQSFWLFWVLFKVNALRNEISVSGKVITTLPGELLCIAAMVLVTAFSLQQAVWQRHRPLSVK